MKTFEEYFELKTLERELQGSMRFIKDPGIVRIPDAAPANGVAFTIKMETFDSNTDLAYNIIEKALQNIIDHHVSAEISRILDTKIKISAKKCVQLANELIEYTKEDV